MTDMKQEILSALGSHPWAETLQYHDCVGSTNDLAKKLADDGAAHGTVIIAGRQTCGRGRMGRSFQSPGGMGIYLSVILRPNCTADQLMHLTCAAGVAMCNAVEKATKYRPGIKWINDLVANDRKLGGILTELSLEHGGSVRYAVVGIGINCHQKPEDFPIELEKIATSLAIATGKPIHRSALAAAMISELADMSTSLLTEKAAVMEQYRRDCVTLHRDVAVIQAGKTVPATAVGLDDAGALLVRYADGTTGKVTSGEVSVRGLFGYC